MSDQYVPALRRRFLEDMQIKGLQPKTQTMYLRAMRDFTRYLGHSPDSATPEELRAFQLDMKEKGVGAPTFNNRLTVLSFFYATTCPRPEMKRHMRYQRAAKKIPVVLSAEEVTRILDAAPGPGRRYRAAFSVAYGGGLRASEVTHLKVGDIDSDRMLIRIDQGIRRVIAPRSLFDPATSDRVFRIAMPTLTKLIAEVSARVEAEAPNVRIEWLPAHHDVYAALSEGLIDLAHLGGEPRLPDGLESQVMEPFTWVTFARRDHPACSAWGITAWRRYPHLMVNVTRSMRNPFPVTPQGDAGARRVSAMVGDSAGVASLLAKSDFLATFPAVLLAWDMDAFGLRAMKPPVDLGPVLVRFFWSSRLAKDAGGIWIRSIVIEAYRRLQAEAEAKLSGNALLQPRPSDRH